MARSVHAVAQHKKPAFMLMLHWPGVRFVTGEKVVGEIESSGLFRQMAVDEGWQVGLPSLLGPAAVANLAPA